MRFLLMLNVRLVFRVFKGATLFLVYGPLTSCSSPQDAVEENEQRKRQEEAMREKLLAREAKQHDPKVRSKLSQTSAVFFLG